MDGGKRGFSECFRLDAKGKIVDTQDRLLNHASASVSRRGDDDDDRPRRRARVERDERYYSRASARGYYQDGWQYERQYQYQYQNQYQRGGGRLGRRLALTPRPARGVTPPACAGGRPSRQ